MSDNLIYSLCPLCYSLSALSPSALSMPHKLPICTAIISVLIPCNFRYQLTPLSYFCADQTAELNEIGEHIISRALDIFVEIKQLKADIAALIDTQVSRAIPSVRQVLTTYKEQLVAHECDIGPKLQTQVTSCFLI